jgi:hypothetical protein
MADCEPLSDAMPVAEHEAVVQELRAGALADLRAKDERLTYWLGRALGAEAEVERLCSENRSTLATKIDLDRLNEARWMACNRRYPPETPSMERASTLADEVVRSYLGISPERWIELFHSAVPATG